MRNTAPFASVTGEQLTSFKQNAILKSATKFGVYCNYFKVVSELCFLLFYNRAKISLFQNFLLYPNTYLCIYTEAIIHLTLVFVRLFLTDIDLAFGEYSLELLFHIINIYYTVIHP